MSLFGLVEFKMNKTQVINIKVIIGNVKKKMIGQNAQIFSSQNLGIFSKQLTTLVFYLPRCVH